jgi:uncharacterized LabA/DUF88 family protein
MPDAVAAISQSANPVRVRIFVDFWNLQLTINDSEAKHGGQSRFDIDWTKLSSALLKEAAEKVGASCSYEGTHVYTSFDRKTEAGKKHGQWAKGWLDRQPGVQVNCCERKPKHPPKCNFCYKSIESCPHCNRKISGTVEKGVDTAVVTDMIRLAWEKSYDAAVLVSSDADMIPAVEFLDNRGIKIIQAGFPPKGIDLATTCWASIDLFACRERFRRRHPPQVL